MTLFSNEFENFYLMRRPTMHREAVSLHSGQVTSVPATLHATQRKDKTHRHLSCIRPGPRQKYEKKLVLFDLRCSSRRHGNRCYRRLRTCFFSQLYLLRVVWKVTLHVPQQHLCYLVVELQLLRRSKFTLLSVGYTRILEKFRCSSSVTNCSQYLLFSPLRHLIGKHDMYESFFSSASTTF